MSSLEVTILFPCLNEERTLKNCLDSAKNALVSNGLLGEIIVADNGSIDRSREIALEAGVRLVVADQKGYGAALITGITAARGEFIVMADADESYDITEVMSFVREFRLGADLVVGNRFRGNIEQKAMPFLHRYLGNPILSFLGRMLFKVPLGDFHCGIRGIRKSFFNRLNLRCEGMEFASEMIVKAALNQGDIREVPATLKRDGRDRPPHLRTWRDGWRHLAFLLSMSPNWLFVLPGSLLATFGVCLQIMLYQKNIVIGGIRLGENTFLLTIALVLIGTQLVIYGLLCRILAIRLEIIRKTSKTNLFLNQFTLERGILLSGLLFTLGGFMLFSQLKSWSASGFTYLDLQEAIKPITLSVILFGISVQILFGSFLALFLQNSYRS